jgi:hypothetical protein
VNNSLCDMITHVSPCVFISMTSKFLIWSFVLLRFQVHWCCFLFHSSVQSISSGIIIIITEILFFILNFLVDFLYILLCSDILFFICFKCLLFFIGEICDDYLKISDNCSIFFIQLLVFIHFILVSPWEISWMLYNGVIFKW